MKISEKLASTCVELKEKAAWVKDAAVKKIDEGKRELMETERIRMLINMALADGTFTDEEKEFLLDMIAAADISNKAKTVLNAEVANPRFKDLNLMLFKTDKEYAQSLIDSMVEIMHIDGAEQAEKDYVASVAQKLGIKFNLSTDSKSDVSAEEPNHNLVNVADFELEATHRDCCVYYSEELDITLMEYCGKVYIKRGEDETDPIEFDNYLVWASFVYQKFDMETFTKDYNEGNIDVDDFDVEAYIMW